MHYYIGPIQIYSGAEVSHTNRCQSVRRTLRHQCRSVSTLRHYNLVPKCPGAEVSRERGIPHKQEAIFSEYLRKLTWTLANFSEDESLP